MDIPSRQHRDHTEETSNLETTARYFLTYSGRQLPLQLTEELQANALRNRNTWFEAEYDVQGRMRSVLKMVYGEVEMRHDYDYDASGRLCGATILLGEEEPQRLEIQP
jgi:hypothetical protein